MGRKWGRTKEIFDAHMGDIERDFEGGADLRDIAARYEVSPPTITNWLIKAGYKHRKRGRYPIAMKEKAVELAGRGWEPVAIARLFRVKLPYVYQWLDLEPEPERATIGRDVVPMEEPEGMRHKIGRRWTQAQKEQVFGFLQAPEVFTVANIYKLTGASRDRQQKIWREFEPDTPFPLPKPQRRPSEAAQPAPELERVDPADEFERGRLAGLEEARQLVQDTPAFSTPVEVLDAQIRSRQREILGDTEPEIPVQDES